MSDSTLTDGMKGCAERKKAQANIPINPRLLWIADVVCAILNAENTKGSTVKRSLDT